MSDLERARRRVTICLVASTALALGWWFYPGLPVLWGPSASAEAKARGQFLFEHEWSPKDALAGGDGLGPVFNAKSCASCHFQGGAGGGGDNRHNVLTFAVLPNPRDRALRQGLVHASAVEPGLSESPGMLATLYPVLPKIKPVLYNCRKDFEDFDPVVMTQINSTALFGAGWIDRISIKAILHGRRKREFSTIARELNLQFDGVQAGRARMLAGGQVGKFGWKGQFATLEEFVAAACANELGLGNPLMEQAKSLRQANPIAVAPDLSAGDFASLVAFVDTLPRPREEVSADPEAASKFAKGRALFDSVGCSICHTPDVGGVKGVYSDFLLYVLEPLPSGTPGYEEPLPDFPLPTSEPALNEWKTPPLWGVADSAPYFHDGGAPTLEKAIARHRGHAAPVTERYNSLAAEEQKTLLSFLKSLRAP